VHSRPWTHTLVLTGELNARTAPALEEEIEGLCQEGVAALRLDLRRLERIDGVGIAVIAFRSQECTRRGHLFDVLSDTPVVRRALTEAGVAVIPEEPPAHGEPKLTLCPGGGEPDGAAQARRLPAGLGRLARWLPGDRSSP
jgi:anti-anti-sigma factor